VTETTFNGKIIFLWFYHLLNTLIGY